MRRISFPALALLACISATPATRPSVTITNDLTAAPQCADFAARAKSAGEAYYPTIAKMLPTDGYTPPAKVTITYKPMKGVAYAQNTRITCSADYFATHPNDVGAIIHELTHVVQHYTIGQQPSWLVEGIADWVRWFNWEPAARRPHANFRTAHYDASYRVSAQFLDWARRTYDPHLIVDLNNALRRGYYHTALWQKYTGHTLDQLGDQWKQSLAPPTPPTTSSD